MLDAIQNKNELAEVLKLLNLQDPTSFIRDWEAVVAPKIEKCRIAFLSGAERPEASSYGFFQTKKNAKEDVFSLEINLAKIILEEAGLGPISTSGKFRV
jgi:hypothetical protein